MVGDPRDRWTYRIAVGALGLALLMTIAGAVVLAVVDDPGAETSSKISQTRTTIRGGLSGTTTMATHVVADISEEASDSAAPSAPVKRASVKRAISVKPAGSATPVTSIARGVAGALISSTPVVDPPGVTIPTGIYLIGGVLLGALMGILIPPPWFTTSRGASTWITFACSIVVGVLLALLIIFGLGAFKERVPHEVVAAAGAAALLGLFVPSPAMRQ